MGIRFHKTQNSVNLFWVGKKLDLRYLLFLWYHKDNNPKWKTYNLALRILDHKIFNLVLHKMGPFYEGDRRRIKISFL